MMNEHPTPQSSPFEGRGGIDPSQMPAPTRREPGASPLKQEERGRVRS